MRTIGAVLFCLILGGCLASNPFTDFYHPNLNVAPAVKSLDPAAPAVEPIVYSGTTFEQDARGLMENGYIQIGYSSFSGPASGQSAVSQHAKKIRAEIAILYSKYRNTQSGAIPWTTPTTQTSFSNVSGSVYGGGGVANYTGRGTTTTYGSQTTYIPYQVDRYDQTATFWAKGKRPVFGAFFRDLTDDMKREIESNKGCFIDILIKGSPAYLSDFFTQDIIRRIGDREIYDTQSAVDAIQYYAGSRIPIQIWRSGKVITKEISLNMRE